jgi:hypothetical protein
LEAQDEVSAMRAGAERDLQASFRLQAAMFQSHVRETAERLHREMLAQAEECARRLSAFEAELEKGLSCLPIPAVKSEEAQHSQDGVIDAVRAAIADQASSPGTDSTPLHHGIETDPREKTVEIKILPPRDKDAIEAIGAYLNRLDEVAAADVVHMTDMTVIRVLLLQPIDLAVRLSGLREVESAREVNEGDSEKIEVVLSVRSELEREREALNTKAHRLATRISRNEEVKRSSPH